MGNAVSRTGQGIYHTAKNTYSNGKEVYTGIKESDMQKVKRGAEGIATTVAVGALAIGVVDFVDGTDGSTEVSAETNNPHGEPGNHSVLPHYVEGYVKADGTLVDGY